MRVLFCDSNCELWYERQEALGIEYISMPYTIDGVEKYYDLGKNTDLKAFFDSMRQGARVITSALNENDYVEAFEPVLAAGNDIYYVTFSHRMSATFERMDKAIATLLEKYPDRRIDTFDSRSISIGAQQIVYEAARNFDPERFDVAATNARLEALRKRLCVVFTPETLTYLARGGRIKKSTAFMGKLFNAKPMLTINAEGSLENYAKVNGRKNAIRHLFDKMNAIGVDPAYPVIVIDADCPEDSRLLVDMIKEAYPAVELWTQPVGPVIGCHCGPGTLGLSFIAPKDLC